MNMRSGEQLKSTYRRLTYAGLPLPDSWPQMSALVDGELGLARLVCGEGTEGYRVRGKAP